jgi:hypothetical protein
MEDRCLPVSGASLTAGGNGSVSAVWYSAGEAGEAGIYSAESRDGGKTFGPRGLLSNGGVSGTPLLFGDAGNAFCIFAARENGVTVRTGPLSGTGSGVTLSIPDAGLPAAAVRDGKPYVAFVRTDGEKRSVWLAISSR